MKIAILFDLDNCLSAADEPGPSLLQPVFDAISRANCGTLAPESLEQAMAECWFQPFDFVAAKHRFSDAMLAAGWEAYSALEVRTPIRGYPDLKLLGELDAKRFLVTSGFRRLQQSKIDALGIRDLFEAIHIDAIDDAERLGKEQIFRHVLGEHGLRPEQVLVVGDSPDSEIRAGKNLGMTTVQILRPGVVRGQNADYYISSLTELPKLLQI